MLKSKFDIASGLLGRESGWLKNKMIADFSQVSAAGALTLRTPVASFPLVNPSHIIKSEDNQPFETPGGLVAGAVVGDRQIGTGLQPVGLILGAYLIRITSAGAVYVPVTTVFNVRVISSALGVAGAFTTVGTFNASAGTNLVESIPLIGTTGRFFSPEGLPNAAAIAIFDGDTVFVECVMSGVVNHQSNLLAVALEMA